MKLVLIRPPWSAWLANRMFAQAEGCVYGSAFSLWRRIAAEHGYYLDTWDMHPLVEADCVWMMDLPPQRRTYELARRKARKGTPFVLQTLESPLLGPQNFVEANYRHFDAVVRFALPIDETIGYFGYQLPNMLQFPSSGIPFAERRCAVMLNTNRVEGYFAVRQPGLTGLPGVGRIFSGWKLSFGTKVCPALGELYSWRRVLARTADGVDSSVLDVLGRGWRGEQISWFPGYPNRPYSCAKGDVDCDEKRELFTHYRFGIAVENYHGHCGYISEKLFDTLMAGAVPVYLGEERIEECIPPDCFVDVRDFPDNRELLLYLRCCPAREWQTMRDAGQAFLNSERMVPFTEEAFAKRMVQVLKSVVPNRG